MPRSALPKIDDDIPVPSKRKYQFEELKVGQSFFMAGGDIRNCWSRASFYKKKLGHEYQMETRKEKGKLGVRCWRIK